MTGSGTKGGCTVNLSNMKKKAPAEMYERKKKGKKTKKKGFILSTTGAWGVLGDQQLVTSFCKQYNKLFYSWVSCFWWITWISPTGWLLKGSGAALSIKGLQWLRGGQIKALKHPAWQCLIVVEIRVCKHLLRLFAGEIKVFHQQLSIRI